MNERFDRLDDRMNHLSSRLDHHDDRFDQLYTTLKQYDQRFDRLYDILLTRIFPESQRTAAVGREVKP
jgi:hypothetical protein